MCTRTHSYVNNFYRLKLIPTWENSNVCTVSVRITVGNKLIYIGIEKDLRDNTDTSV